MGALPLDEGLMRSLVEAAPDALLLVDESGRIAFANARIEPMFGYARGELVGQPVEVLIPRRFREAHVGHRSAFVGAGQLHPMGDFRREVVGLRRDGTEFPVEVSLNAIRLPRCTFVVAAVRDVTERKRAEEALRRSEESLNEAQRVAHIGSWDWDLRTNEVSRSREIFAIYGVEPSSEYAKPYSFSPLVHPADRARVVETVERAVREGGPLRVEHRIIRPDGTERVVVQQGEVVREGDRSVRLVATIRDVTERKQVEREREESLRWMRAVLEQSPVGLMLVHGPRGDRLEANGRAQQMIGRPLASIDEYVGLLFTPDGQPLARDDMPSVRALRGETTANGEFLVRSAGGGTMPVLASAAPIVGPDGAVLGAVVAFQDITASKELERLRAEWGSVVAHDLRQPLGSISLTAQILGRLVGDPALLKHVERVRAAANRLNRMVGDLMDLSRVEARRLELARQPVDVPALVRASVECVALEAPDRRFDVHVRGGVPEAQADPDRVAQVMENLLTNAVKHGKAGTPVVVTVGREDGQIAVAVTNEGPRIEREELSRIFQRFQRTASARMEGITGVGLGLYIARSLVEAHGGRITAESTPEGVNTFRFTLPAASGSGGRGS